MKKIVLFLFIIIQFIKADDYVVLVDLSDDVVGEVKGKYLKSFRDYDFNYGDTIYLFPISANSQNPQPTAIVKIDEESKRYTKKKNERIRKSQVEEIQDAFRRILRTTEQETRILDALKNAGKTFDMNNTPKDKRKILLFCDMVEYSSVHRHWFKKKILNINDVKVPNLNADVTIFGLGFNLQTKLESSQIDKIEKFWREYFNKSNSSMKKEYLK